MPCRTRSASVASTPLSSSARRRHDASERCWRSDCRLGAGKDAFGTDDVGAIDHLAPMRQHTGTRVLREQLYDLLGQADFLRRGREELVDDGDLGGMDCHLGGEAVARGKLRLA